jgi:4-amino-4-deoxy-L-arabinose transferase-like glycosyltransferase
MDSDHICENFRRAYVDAILPQALAGAGSVYLLYALIKPKFGKGAARISALVMALTPITVAVSRTNNIDSMLVFTLLLGTWCLMKAVKQGRLLWPASLHLASSASGSI